jgi:hypothetical protein
MGFIDILTQTNIVIIHKFYGQWIVKKKKKYITMVAHYKNMDPLMACKIETFHVSPLPDKIFQVLDWLSKQQL